MSLLNMEPLCARHGMAMIAGSRNSKESENVVTRALAVLAENGIYAMSLYLLTCKGADNGKILTRHIRQLFQESGINLIEDGVSENGDQMLEAVRGIAENLSNLILAKKLTEQTLTFARYHAKASNTVSPVDGLESGNG